MQRVLDRLRQIVGPDTDPRPLAAALDDGYRAGGQAPQQRPYHHVGHALYVADILDRLHPAGQATAAAVAAALYHDVVCTPGRAGRNELESMQFCFAALSPLPGMDPRLPYAACTLIWATAQSGAHLPLYDLDDDARRFLDADHFVLGEPAADYDAYTAAVRAEYAAVPDDAWRAGRGAFLRRFLSRDRLYLSDWPGRADHEARARANLARELSSLTAS